jgi:flagellar biosynthetic protein FliO
MRCCHRSILIFLAALMGATSALAQGASTPNTALPTPPAAELAASPTAAPAAAEAPITPEAPAATPARSDRPAFLADTRNDTETGAPSAAGLLLRTLGALLLIIGLIVAAAGGLRRVGGARFGAPRADAPELAVLATVALGDRRALAVVRFGQRTLLLGSTAQQITLLATEDSDAQASAPPFRSVAEMLREDQTPSFDQALERAQQRFAAANSEATFGARRADEDQL